MKSTHQLFSGIFKFRLFLVFITSLMLFSCANKKKLIYFQGASEMKSEAAVKFMPVLKVDDLLSITVMSSDADAVRPFNLATYGQQSGGLQGNTPSQPGGASGYLVDMNGEIEFPVVGKLKVAGLTRPQASELIRNKLSGYVNQAIVNIQILNFKITILGDVNIPGVITVPNERITIIEAIGRAGDLAITGLRKNILVIRDQDGKKTETRVDITSKEIFNSPVYYLQQNDVVYVEQNRPKKNSSAVFTTGITLIISITTLLITLTTLLIK